jgi:hypothetical protein
MTLDGKSYVPTLAIRGSEMNGLQYLPKATKDRMTPCILLCPWVNSNTLEKAIERVEKAFRGQSYFLDLDRDYEPTNLESAPQRRLVELMDPSDAYANWCEFVAEYDWVMPCVQTRGQSEADIRRQIERYQEAGKSYCLRLYMNRFPPNTNEAIAALAAVGAADYTIMLEGGWTRDPLSLAAWFDSVMVGQLDPIDADVPIVLSCTSMPKMFTNFDGGISRVPFSNHELVDQIRRNRGNRRSRIIYGDWGSTRPREPSGFGSRPLDRIDYPTEQNWCIARNRQAEWDFQRAAQAIVSSPEWQGDLGIWGEEMIEATAINEELGIDTPQKNVAARTNIHLHRQAFYGDGNLGGMNLDEDWED